jgi:hypothetical protein
MSYAVRFDFPESDQPLFAGLHKGAFGWAPTLATALIYDDADKAAAALENAYGENSKRFGRVVQVKAGYPVG